MTSMAIKPSATSTEQAQVTANQVCMPAHRAARRGVVLVLVDPCTLALAPPCLLTSNCRPSPPQSLTLMRNLLRTGVSTICYMRDIFGDEEFSVRAHCHLSVLLLPCKSEG
jgi:hypothetical protein